MAHFVSANTALQHNLQHGQGLVWDGNSGLWYDTHTNYYFDPNQQLWYDPQSGLWNDPDDPTGQWFDINAPREVQGKKSRGSGGGAYDYCIYEDAYGNMEDSEGNVVYMNEYGNPQLFLGAELPDDIPIVYRDFGQEQQKEKQQEIRGQRFANPYGADVEDYCESLDAYDVDPSQWGAGSSGDATGYGMRGGAAREAKPVKIDFEDRGQEGAYMTNERIRRTRADTLSDIKSQYKKGDLHKYAKQDKGSIKIPFGVGQNGKRKMPKPKYIYDHNPDPEQDAVEQAKRSRPPCLNHYEGKCKMGHFCYWRHDTDQENKVFFDVLDCPLKHGVYLVKAFPKRGYMCDICQREIEMYSNVYQCRNGECKFDCCPRCANGARHINQIGVKEI